MTTVVEIGVISKEEMWEGGGVNFVGFERWTSGPTIVDVIDWPASSRSGINSWALI